jgi:2-C-methyl-D-erythritol 2,4-cyclodiphosphate synthase
VAVYFGIGYDSHRLGGGRPLVLGGVEIPYDLGLIGHSDADVVCHAVIDAVLGASRKGDIGERFPDTDPRFKDANSLRLLEEVVGELAAERLFPRQVDLTVIAQRPKLAPYKDRIRANLAAALQLEEGDVNVKATTGEGIGFVGREEGIACLAVAAVERLASL